MKIITVDEAVSLIKDNDHVIISSFGNFSVCKSLLMGLKRSYLENKKPNNLTIITSVGSGNLTYEDEGLNIIAEVGLVKHIVTSHLGMCKKMAELVGSNYVSSYMMPLGVYLDLLDSMIRKKDGVISKIGLNTFCDPRISDNKFTKVVEVNNQEYLYYKGFSVDVCFVKAKFCDKFGNISIKKDEIINDILEVVMVGKRYGAKVIVEVDEIVDKIEVDDIYIPAILVDYVVISEYKEKVIIKNREIKASRLKCATRTYMETSYNDVINIGVGMPDIISDLIIKDNNKKNLTVTVESGVIGGKIGLGEYFGSSSGYDYKIRMNDMLKLYNSNFLDVAFLGAAQIDKFGNVNVSKFKNRTVGAGGFIDIISNAKKIVFLTTLVTKNNEAKFVDKVEEITFASKNALLNNQDVLYITDICVFKLTNNGLELIEVDNDVDINNDILKYIEFDVKVSNCLKGEK